MKTGFKLLTVLLLITSSINSFGQDEENVSLNEANELAEKVAFSFEGKNYKDALDQFTQLYNYKPSDLYCKLMMGICPTDDPVQKQKAIEIIEEEKITNPEYNFFNGYLSKYYVANYQCNKAVNLFNMFLARADTEDSSQKDLAKKMIKNWKNAKEILTDTIYHNVGENIQFSMNSHYTEYVPIISATESLMVHTFTNVNTKGVNKIEVSMGLAVYSEDVFISYKKNGIRTAPVSIRVNIKNEDHDASIALSMDSQTLFVYKTGGGGDIYRNRLFVHNWLKPKKLKGDVTKTESWEGSCSLSANGKVIYFDSHRAGGLGGRALYMLEIQKDGAWGLTENLGNVVNTTHNEDAPFIHPDSKTFDFNSQGHTSIGGFLSNMETGKYVMALTPGHYDIKVVLASGEKVLDAIRLDSLTEYIVIKKYFRIYNEPSIISKNDPSFQDLLAKELASENKPIADNATKFGRQINSKAFEIL
jgi:hypothetical protein